MTRSLLLLLVAISVGACGASAASTAGSVSPSVRSALLTKANRLAAFEGDPRPYDIEAVRSTARKAERFAGGQANLPPPASPVYLVAMRGHFHCNTCSHPAGATIPPGTVITFTVLAKTLKSFESSLSKRYPHLRKLGTPFRL